MWAKAFIGDDGSQVSRKGLLAVVRTNLERLEPMLLRTQLLGYEAERQKTRKTSQCEVFLLRSLSPAQFIRLSWITSDEKKVNKPLRDTRPSAQKWNVGKFFTVRRIWNWKQGLGTSRADVSGNARHFCEIEFNYTGRKTKTKNELTLWARFPFINKENSSKWRSSFRLTIHIHDFS